MPTDWHAREPFRAVHVIAGLHPKNGGPAYTVPRLCTALQTAGCKVRLISIREDGIASEADDDRFRHDYRIVPWLGALRFSAELRHAAHRAAKDVDLVHAHGLWLMPNIYAGAAAAQSRKPLVVSPRGMLAPEALAFSRNKKKIFWALLQRKAYSGAHAWHATSAEEAKDIRAFGIKAPIAIIPNGIDLPALRSPQVPRSSRRTLLFLSRLHPKKGLPVLIASWGRIAPRRPEWDLVIAGPDEGGHRASLEAQARAENTGQIRFLDPVYGTDKQDLLEKADLFVLPTQNENFGIAVAEALAAGIPAIVTKGAPWGGLETERCGWWIEHGSDALEAALLEATAYRGSDLKAMGERARAWMQRSYGWDALADQMLDVYRWLKDGGSPPPCMVRD